MCRNSNEPRRPQYWEDDETWAAYQQQVQKMKQTIILDFDGVLHSYTSGWKGAAIIPDPPVTDTNGMTAKEAVAKLRERYIVVVVSSRCHQEGGQEAIKAWLNLHGITVDMVTNDKPPHICTVDDRAFRFEGDWQAVIDGVEKASIPWNKKENAP